jgi:cytochrome c oxidase subunit II
MPFAPEQASANAASVDLLFTALNLMTLVFSVGIWIAIIYFAVKYRRGHKVDRSNPPLEHLAIELTWTIGPLAIVMGLFVWATVLYFREARPPAGAMQINVVGKQWMWKLQQPQGRWEMNELHVPVGRPVQLRMTSEDVIHSFFVPAFRLKTDVLPGKYSTMWFTPTKPGRYHLFCAEYCGTSHSGMVGSVVVMTPSDYELWLRSGNTNRTRAAAGEQLFRQNGCSGCHGAGSSVRAPMLEGVYGKPVAIEVPTGKGTRQTTTTIADDRYIHDSIVLPEQEVAAGYEPIMPTFRGRLSEEEIVQLVDYIKSLSTGSTNTTANNQGGQNSRDMSAQDIQTRTGFVPPNMGTIRGDVTKNVTGTVPSSNVPEAGANLVGTTGGGGVAGTSGARGTVSGDVTKNVTGAVPTSNVPESRFNNRDTSGAGAARDAAGAGGGVTVRGNTPPGSTPGTSRNPGAGGVASAAGAGQ